ncbi:MAG: type IV secretory system conjugative DNA transfer family protein, partial [Candidatus Dojkabacteria bacterium]
KGVRGLFPGAGWILGKRAHQKLSLSSKYIKRFLDERSRDIINIEELASLYHLPNQSVDVSGISWSRSKKLPFPKEISNANAHATDDPQTRILGVTDYRNMHYKYGVKKADRRRHAYVLGKTGTGKSTMLLNMIMGDIYAGNGVGVLDPHGDLIDSILDLIPEERIDDVALLDPSDLEYPVGFNILKLKEGEERDIVADGIVEIFRKEFGDSWGPRLQYILSNAVATLLQAQNISLLGVIRLLEDKNYRKFILKQVDDPILKKYWESEYEQMAKNPKLLTESLSPIQNKVGRFLSAKIIRNIVGQVKSTIDLEEAMNKKKILLVNLSQGKIGEENSSLLGGMLITRIYTNAMQRVKIPEGERTDFYLYVDEFQNFATTTFVKILSEARKYGLNLTVAHQYIDQLLPEVRDAIFGNVGTMLNFVVGPRDASELEKEYRPHLEAEDLVNLDRYHYVNKITIDGSQTPPFTGIALPPDWQPQGQKQEIMELSRAKYATPKAEIEDKIARWAASEYNDKGNLVQK